MSLAATADLRRDVRIIGLVGSAHFVSHFFQLALPPLFPLLKDAFGVPYVALGLMMSLFYGASGIGQTVSGFLVDRFGARRILLAGMSFVAGGIGLGGLSVSYWTMVPLVVVAGLGNSVFHPADYSIFNASVDPRRLGRAYSVHGICGNVGWAVSPVVVGGLTALFGWRAALVTAGGLGLLAVAVLGSQPVLADHGGPAARRAGGRAGGLRGDVRLLLATPILLAFAYFALLSTSMIGIQTFSVPALVAIYEAPIGLATGALTAFLLGNSVGILIGGGLADRASRHDVVAATGMFVAAALAVVVASAAPPAVLVPAVMALTGVCLGATSPSRDMLVRAATPSGASGKVFGFVYSGLDLGSCVTPPLFGWLLDHGEPRAVFWVSAAFMLVTIATVLQVRRHAVAAAARS